MAAGHLHRGVDPVANAATRFAALADLFDARTKRCLLQCGVGAGWRCLEVGAGGGSIAGWLSEQVGAGGKVVATDIDPRFLGAFESDNLEIIRHDITTDPMPEGTFDLVHTRMILIHLPERDEVLRRLAGVLRPGGWLVCEEFDSVSVGADGVISPGEVTLKTHDAMQRLSTDNRVERRFGRLLFGRFRALGLAEVGADAWMSMVQVRSPMTMLLRASYELRRSAMIEAGYVTANEFEADLARMDADDFMMPSPIMWTVWGRRP
jgi:ubiquinone/menaquinone biosynthesis C-methylase UbiE